MRFCHWCLLSARSLASKVLIALRKSWNISWQFRVVSLNQCFRFHHSAIGVWKLYNHPFLCSDSKFQELRFSAKNRDLKLNIVWKTSKSPVLRIQRWNCPKNLFNVYIQKLRTFGEIVMKNQNDSVNEKMISVALLTKGSITIPSDWRRSDLKLHALRETSEWSIKTNSTTSFSDGWVCGTLKYYPSKELCISISLFWKTRSNSKFKLRKISGLVIFISVFPQIFRGWAPISQSWCLPLYIAPWLSRRKILVPGYLKVIHDMFISRSDCKIQIFRS